MLSGAGLIIGFSAGALSYLLGSIPDEGKDLPIHCRLRLRDVVVIIPLIKQIRKGLNGPGTVEPMAMPGTALGASLLTMSRLAPAAPFAFSGVMPKGFADFASWAGDCRMPMAVAVTTLIQERTS